MSEAWGADHIPQPRGFSGNLVEALSGAQHLPVEALDAASRQPGRVVDAVLDVVEKAGAGAALQEREQNLLFWGIHTLAQARETRLFAPLLRLLSRNADELDVLLGDALAATVPRVVASVFDGDIDALERAASDREADEYARCSLFQAMTFLVVEGRIPRERVHSHLIRFDAERLARAGEAIWSAWEEAIALLGFTDLAPRVAAAMSEGRLLEGLNGPDWFATALADAVAHPEDRSRFDPVAYGYIKDAAAELDAMLGAAGGDAEPEEPVRNPLREIGRNDPCPCGSGKKYKKCCLDKAE